MAVIVVNLGLPRFPAYPSLPAEVDRANSGIQEALYPATLQSPFYLSNPMALKAKKTKDPDLPSTREALAGPHAEHFWKAMDKEIESLESKGTWDVVHRCWSNTVLVIMSVTWE